MKTLLKSVPFATLFPNDFVKKKNFWENEIQLEVVRCARYMRGHWNPGGTPRNFR